MKNHVSDEKLLDICQRYLTDIVYSYKRLESQYTPLFSDPSITVPAPERALLQCELRRGMSIIEAERSLRRFVLVGEPGSGKTTSLQYLSLRYAQRLTENLSLIPALNSDHNQLRIPVLLEMNLYRAVEGYNGIRRMIDERFYPYTFSERFDKRIEDLLHSGSLLIILDGLNECPLALWDNAMRDIKHFLLQHSGVHCILSCRMRDFPDIFHLSVLSIRPMSKASIDKFIIRAFHDVKDKERKSDNFKKLLSSKFIEIARNPLLLSIALNVYRETNWHLPNNYGALFRDFFAAWFRREGLKLRKSASTARLMIMFELLGAIGSYMQNRGEVRTSQEAIWGVIRACLERYIDRNVIVKDQYTADSLLDEFLGMGLLTESGGRVKFYHQLFQEFFSGYSLLREHVDEAVRRLSYSWWEEPLQFYAGLTDDATPLIHEALQKNTVFDAAGLVKACDKCDNEMRLTVYRNLFTMLTDKFSLNRSKALEYLITDPDTHIDAFLGSLLRSEVNDELAIIYKSVRDGREKRKKRIRELSIDHTAKVDASQRISEPIRVYGGSIVRIIQNMKRDLTEKNIESSVILLREIATEIGADEVEKALFMMIRPGLDVNSLLFIAWCLAVLKENRGIECLIDAVPEEQIAALFPEKWAWPEHFDRETRVMLNILFNPDVALVWLLEFVQFDLQNKPVEDLERPYADCLKSIVKKSGFTSDRLLFHLQILWDIGPDFAEEYILSWLNEGIQERYGETLLHFLTQYGLSEHNFSAGFALFEKAPSNVCSYFPELLAKTGSKKSLSFLMNLSQDESQPLSLRSASVAALEWQAGKDEIVFLRELINSDVPELFDPAYRVLDRITRRIQYDVKIFAAETAEDMALDFLMDEVSPVQSPGQARVIVDRDDQKSAVINGVRLQFGTVSGRIFFYLAKNSTLGSYRTVDEIREYLALQDFYLIDTAVRNRIADIRKKIMRALEGRVDTHYLLENARRFGYRVNAHIEVK